MFYIHQPYFHYLMSPAFMIRVFRLVLFVLLAPLQSWGMVVNYILEAMFLEVQS